jgi:hypothetical protein
LASVLSYYKETLSHQHHVIIIIIIFCFLIFIFIFITIPRQNMRQNDGKSTRLDRLDAGCIKKRRNFTSKNRGDQEPRINEDASDLYQQSDSYTAAIEIVFVGLPI